MKVVEALEQDKTDQSPQQESNVIKMKKFKFVMLIFILVFATAGITTFALAFGDEKAVNVGVTDRSEFTKLYDAYDKLNDNYYKDLDKDTLIDGAINGMIESVGDPYSDYMDKDEAKKFDESISSSFEGIGAEIQEKDGYIAIVSPIKGSPAESAGLKPNDKILKVDDKSIQGMSVSEAVLLIRGEKGSKVTLTVQRPGQDKSMEMTITRDEIPIETVYAEMKKDGVAKIQITSFSEHTYKELTEALNEMNDKGMKKLVIDLRQNPGGLLDQAIKISNLFVPEGEVMFQVEDSNGKVEKYVAEGGDKIDIPTAVLVDGGSASAAEILAAAVSESNDIPLVGTKTFGKGTVQTAEEFKDGSNMKFTTAKWLTPEGNWIHEKGIKPTVEVKMPDYAELPYLNPDKELKESDLSDQVKTAEQMLNALDFNPGNVDGYYDEDTTKAVEKFQESKKLKVTGKLDSDTIIQLMDSLREKLQKNDPQFKKAVEQLNKKN